MPSVERALADPHPSAAGHFPGNPVIPGAVLLAEVLSVVAAGLGSDLSAAHVRSAKFLAPVRPGDRLVIDYSRASGGAIRFSCAVGDRAVLRGEVACDASSTPA